MRLIFALLLLAGAALPLAARAQERVALLIANAAYQHTSPLRNPPNDAAEMAAVLRDLGFHVMPVVQDADSAAMTRALVDFAHRAATADTALIFYSGHGMELGGRNYLIPVEARLSNEAVGAQESVSLERLRQAAGLASRLSVVIIDACRNNQFAGMTKGARGLEREFGRPGEVLAFSTAPGTVAQDGAGRLSPYTKALTERLRRTPGQDVRIIFSSLRLPGSNQIPFAEFGHLPETTAALGAARPQVAVQPAALPTPAEPLTFRDCPECPLMRRIPGGTFMMGSDASETDRFNLEADRAAWERPRHSVTVRPFALGVHEVTVGEYRRFVEATGRGDGDGCWWVNLQKAGGAGWELDANRSWRSPGFEQTDDHPVVCVNVEDAEAYIGWLSRTTGRTYRLASEAEWEYAARAGTTAARYWGEDASATAQCAYANGADEAYHTALNVRGGASCQDGYVYTAPVGRFAANAYDLHDMLGNVFEWTEDCWNATYSGAPVDGSTWRSGECSRNVLRGGSWIDPPRFLRAAFRDWGWRELRGSNIGFRVARTLP